MSLQDKKLYEINLNVEQLNVVLGALGEMPAKVAMNVILSIQTQAQTQDQSPPVAQEQE